MESKNPTNIPILMNALLANLNNFSADDLARIGVSVQAARALVMLGQYAELRCAMLSRMLGLESATLSHLLRSLSNKRLILRARVPNDNRAVVVGLTAKGRRVASACRDLALANERALMEGLEAREVQLFERILTRMGQNVTPRGRWIDVSKHRASRRSAKGARSKRHSARRSTGG